MAYFLSFIAGIAWGLANAWVLVKGVRCVLEGQRRWKLAAWAGAKLVGVYGLAAWMLIGLRLPAVAWMAGFTCSLAILGFKAFRNLAVHAATRTAVLFLGLLSVAGQAFASAPAHGEAAAAPAHPPEIPNLLTVILHFMPESHLKHFLHTWENAIFAFVIVGILAGLMALAARKATMQPGRGQAFAETVIEGLEGLVNGVLGKEHGRKYLPFLGTLFIFILGMNLAGLVPGLKSPTSRFEMTFSLALCVFFVVQWTAIKSYGFFGYMYHLMNMPKDAVGWVLAPLMFFIELVGEIVKPVSLALRLFGNIMGEDTLLGVFVVLGAMTMAWSHLPLGLPLHLPFVLLAIIFSIVQALVFTSLSMIYIYTKLPHEEHAVEQHGAQAAAVTQHE